MESRRLVLRGVGIVVLGLAACAAASIGTDGALRVLGVFPPSGQAPPDALFLIPLAYRMAYATVSTYFVARFAPVPQWRYVWLLGAIGFLMCLGGIAAMSGKSAEKGPMWYPIALAASVLPTTVVGGWLCLCRSRVATAVANETP
jgi:hypothetical protein